MDGLRLVSLTSDKDTASGDTSQDNTIGNNYCCRVGRTGLGFLLAHIGTSSLSRRTLLSNRRGFGSILDLESCRSFVQSSR